MGPFTARSVDSIASLGERRLIQLVREWLGSATPRSPAGIGDDCAVMAASGRPQLVTVDPVIYGEHFDDQVPARRVGEKLFKRNLSDIAAMGGRPRAAVVALALDAGVRIAWLKAFHQGLAHIARRYAVPVVGGDVARHRGGIVATLTLIGEAASGRALTRTGARAGDWIYVTGGLGGSILGHHWHFTPRLAEGAWLAARAEPRALIDLSDGLAKDILDLTPAGSRAVVPRNAVPISRAARLHARRTGRDPLDHALSDGEDYELLFAVDRRADCAAFEAAWRRRFQLALTRLGRFERIGSPRAAVPAALRWEDYHGYEHLR